VRETTPVKACSPVRRDRSMSRLGVLCAWQETPMTDLFQHLISWLKFMFE